MHTAKNPLVVIHCPAGGGHRAAAIAVAESAHQRGLPAVVLDGLALGPNWFRHAYVSAHLGSSAFVPSLYGGAYFASNRRHGPSDGLRRRLDRALGSRMLRSVLALRPSAVVATHFYPLTVLSEARRRGTLAVPVIGVVTDYAAHAVWADPHADALCAAPGRAVQDLLRHGVRRDRILSTGIPIRRSFGQVEKVREPGHQGAMRVLVTCGGFGVGPMMDVLRSFTGLRHMQLTVVCGHNPGLVQRARRLAARRALDAEVIGFEPDMAARVADAHLVVGKPGGLTVSESLAAGRPMALVGAVPGQETLNQRWLIEHGAAVSASARGVGPRLESIRQSLHVAPMASAARRLGRASASDDVVSGVLEICSHATLRAA